MVKTAIVAGVALGLAGASEAFMPSPAMHGVVGARARVLGKIGAQRAASAPRLRKNPRRSPALQPVDPGCDHFRRSMRRCVR
jgi:hypothetical protein